MFCLFTKDALASMKFTIKLFLNQNQVSCPRPCKHVILPTLLRKSLTRLFIMRCNSLFLLLHSHKNWKLKGEEKRHPL